MFMWYHIRVIKKKNGILAKMKRYIIELIKHYTRLKFVFFFSLSLYVYTTIRLCGKVKLIEWIFLYYLFLQ